MKLQIVLFGLATMVLGLVACGDTVDEPQVDPVTITAQDFTASIQENPAVGDTLGQISVDVDPAGTEVSIQMSNVDPAGAIEFTGNGYITVADAGLFDLTARTSVSGEYTASVGEVESTASIDITITADTGGESTLWTGPTFTFEKPDGGDPTEAANQDRLTDRVIITRGNQGQIFNIAVEASADKENSPVGTQWAFGSIADDVSTLDFQRFRDLGKPKTFENRPMVMYLMEDDIYVDVTFLTWSENNNGGFSYERSTPN